MAMKSLARGAWLLGALVLLTTPASAGSATMRHSGLVVEVGNTSFVLAEVGPWRREGGETVVTYRTIEVASETPLALVARDDAAPSGFAGDFVESTLVPWGIVAGDFVTVDCLHIGRRQIARGITVFEPHAP
jgi:hypothetical protein